MAILTSTSTISSSFCILLFLATVAPLARAVSGAGLPPLASAVGGAGLPPLASTHISQK